MRSRRRLATVLACAVTAVATGTTAVVVVIDRNATTRPVLPPPRYESAAGPARMATPAPVHAPVRTPPVSVNGRPVVTHGPESVAAVLHAAGIAIRPGRYLSVVTHRPLRSNGQPGGASVNGHRATLATTVRPGDRVVVHQGPSRVEPTERVVVRLHPVVPSALYVGGHAGLARVVRGTISHEVVSEQVLRRPQAGHLLRPGAVAVTFDDGPSRYWTRAVVTLLHRHRVPATFCMIGRQVRFFPGLVRRIARDGNALCDHTWDHDLNLSARPHRQQVLDIRRATRAIERWAGVRPQFFRAPGGDWSGSLEAIARAEGMRPLGWTVDPRDWARPGVRAIVRAVMRQLRPGGVILLHDGGGHRRQTLAALRILLHRLPRLGYHFVLPPD